MSTTVESIRIKNSVAKQKIPALLVVDPGKVVEIRDIEYLLDMIDQAHFLLHQATTGSLLAEDAEHWLNEVET